MELKKQDTTTGNGYTEIPGTESENAPTEERSKPSHTSTSIEGGSTKPVSLEEALSLLQTLCLDLRSMDCELAILARNRRVYLVIEVPASIGIMGIADGHITINGQPVSVGGKNA